MFEIDISPKALRFARLAAERQSSLSRDAEIETIKQRERAYEEASASERLRRHVKISGRTAAFCLRAVNDLLENPANFQTSEWDGNDFAFLQAVAQDLGRRLVEHGERVS